MLINVANKSNTRETNKTENSKIINAVMFPIKGDIVKEK
jgi:hypothetical protein